jgi:hypothetical protein
MKTRGFSDSSILTFVRRIVQDLLALFRFTETDASTLLSAYGLSFLEVDRLQYNRPNEQKERSGSLETVSHRNPVSEPPAPIPIGVHPDLIRANWTITLRNKVSCLRKGAKQSQLRRRSTSAPR